MQHRASGRRADIQHHHILPLGLARRPQIGRFLAGLYDEGFSLHDRSMNCIALPSSELLAVSMGRALHRGPHPHYTDVVASRVDHIRRRNRHAADATLRLRRLQRALARVLGSPGQRVLHLNRRDSMRAFADYAYLDSAIDLAFCVPAEECWSAE